MALVGFEDELKMSCNQLLKWKKENSDLWEEEALTLHFNGSCLLMTRAFQRAGGGPADSVSQQRQHQGSTGVAEVTPRHLSLGAGWRCVCQ